MNGSIKFDLGEFFFRHNHHGEVDLVLRRGNQLIPVEIKSSGTYQPDFLKGLNYFEKLFGKRVTESWLIYDGKLEQAGSQKIMNYRTYALKMAGNK
jgi:hypothetical protein